MIPFFLDQTEDEWMVRGAPIQTLSIYTVSLSFWRRILSPHKLLTRPVLASVFPIGSVVRKNDPLEVIVHM